MPVENPDTIPEKLPAKVVQDCDDYGGIGPEEFARLIQADNDERYGDILRNAKWEPVGEPGW